MPNIWSEIRHPLRGMRRARSITIATVLTLAIGIGAVAAVYSVVDAVVVRALPYAHADRLVLIEGTYTPPPPGTPKRALDITDWAAMRGTFRDLALVFTGGANLSRTGQAQRVTVAQVMPNLFDLLGVRPVHGRAFSANDGIPGHEGVAIVSSRLWHQQFGTTDPALGQTILLDDRPFVIVGVVPSALAFPAGTDVWIPYVMPHNWRTDLFYGRMTVLTRLQDGVTFQQAQTTVARAEHAFAVAHPQYDAVDPVALAPLRTVLVGDARTKLVILAGAAALMLLLACANVGGLLLARAESRRHELAVRMAIGATPARLVRHLLIEGAVFATVGTIAGLGLAWALQPVLVSLVPADLAGIAPVRLDLRVLLGAALIGVVSTALFCLAPAISLWRTDVHAVLKSSGPRSSSAIGQLWRRLLIGQIGVTVVILVSAGLLLKSFWLLQRAEAGFDRQGVLTIRVALPHALYATRPQIIGYYRTVLAQASQIRGVEATGVVNSLPLTGGTSDFAYDIVGAPPVADRAHRPMAEHLVASPGYFQALRIPVLAGRTFTESDLTSGASVIVVGERLAHRFGSTRNAIGKLLRMPWDSTYRIVGVVQAVRDRSLDGRKAPPAQFYFPYTLDPASAMTIVIRGPVEDPRFVQAIRTAIRDVDPSIPPYALHTMREVVATSVTPLRTVTMLLATGAAFGLVLAAVGLFGVIAASVTRRTPELGVRLALGATRTDVARLVLRHALVVAGWGLAIGLLGAWAVTRMLTHVLYQVQPIDPTVLVAVGGSVGVAAVIAAAVPAWRASGIDPVTALREE